MRTALWQPQHVVVPCGACGKIGQLKKAMHTQRDTIGAPQELVVRRVQAVDSKNCVQAKGQEEEVEAKRKRMSTIPPPTAGGIASCSASIDVRLSQVDR